MKVEIRFDRSSGLFRIRKSYASGGGTGHDICGPYWMLIRITAEGGDVMWRCDSKNVCASRMPAWLFVPPYGWSAESSSRGTRMDVDGIASLRLLPRMRFTEPTLFHFDGKFPESFQEVVRCLDQARDPIAIPTCRKPRAISTKLKNLLDIGRQKRSIGQLAKSLRSSPAALSRAFKQDYGFPPVTYRRGLQITLGMFSLMSGATIAEAAACAGYRDVSRFNKQFREYLGQSPKQYKIARQSIVLPKSR